MTTALVNLVRAPSIVSLLMTVAGLSLQAQVVENYRFTTFSDDASLSIPDGLATGVSDTRTINGSVIAEISSITVDLDISGQFNGDLYGYLQHDAGFSVLLNSAGRTLSAFAGY